jgi:hypothetical protein
MQKIVGERKFVVGEQQRKNGDWSSLGHQYGWAVFPEDKHAFRTPLSSGASKHLADDSRRHAWV